MRKSSVYLGVLDQNAQASPVRSSRARPLTELPTGASESAERQSEPPVSPSEPVAGESEEYRAWVAWTRRANPI